DQHVRQDRDRVAAFDHRLDMRQATQQLRAFDGGFHQSSDPLARPRPESPTSAGISRFILSGAAPSGKNAWRRPGIRWGTTRLPQATTAMPPYTCSVWPVM